MLEKANKSLEEDNKKMLEQLDKDKKLKEKSLALSNYNIVLKIENQKLRNELQMIQNLQRMANDSLDGATLMYEKKSFHQVLYCLLLLVNIQISRTSDDEFKWMIIIRSGDVTRTLIGGGGRGV